MKKNYMEPYDNMRTNKFKTPAKIKNVEELLVANDIVLNWWCRQSGKTLTNVKICRDFIIRDTSHVYMTTHSVDSGAEFIERLKRSIPNELILTSSKFKIMLKNGSIVNYCSPISMPTLLSDADFIIIDEFEFIKEEQFAQILLTINKLINPSWIRKFLSKFNNQKILKSIFSSSNKSGNNYRLFKTMFPTIKANLLNWEKLPNFDKVHMEQMLGEKSFKLEYDSYSSEENL